MRIDEDWMHRNGVDRIMDMLCAERGEAYFVGGCVRNALLGVPVSDIDISTNLLPDQVEKRAEAAGIKSIPTGKDHGTITLVVDDTAYEVTSYRKDVATDGRRAVVAFAKTLEEDALRRDFTINALYADRTGTVRDPVDGLADIDARRIRFIGNAEDRIKEDYLRILRFFRFSTYYGDPEDGFDAESLAACAEHADGLETLSKERIGWEMRKILSAEDPMRAIATMGQTGILRRILPGANPAAIGPFIAAELWPDWLGRLYALNAETPKVSLKLSRKESDVFEQMDRATAQDLPIHEIAYRLGARVARNIGALRASLTAATGWSDADETSAHDAEAQVFPLKARDLNGLEGKALGDKLKELEAKWIASEFQMTRDELLRIFEA